MWVFVTHLLDLGVFLQADDVKECVDVPRERHTSRHEHEVPRSVLVLVSELDSRLPLSGARIVLRAQVTESARNTEKISCLIGAGL